MQQLPSIRHHLLRQEALQHRPPEPAASGYVAPRLSAFFSDRLARLSACTGRSFAFLRSAQAHSAVRAVRPRALPREPRQPSYRGAGRCGRGEGGGGQGRATRFPKRPERFLPMSLPVTDRTLRSRTSALSAASSASAPPADASTSAAARAAAGRGEEQAQRGGLALLGKGAETAGERVSPGVES